MKERRDDERINHAKVLMSNMMVVEATVGRQKGRARMKKEEACNKETGKFSRREKPASYLTE